MSFRTSKKSSAKDRSDGRLGFTLLSPQPLPDYRDNLCPLLPDYHDNLLPDYREAEQWEKLKVSGEALLQKFLTEELQKISAVRTVEKSFTLSVTNLDLPFVGVIDLVADVAGTPTVVDFKTSGAKYEEHEAPLSDQLTAYQLAEPGAAQLALCVLVKTKEPKIEWHVTRRSSEQLTKYLVKAGFVSRDIAASRFFTVSGKHCSWCDFLPVCLGNMKKVRETLLKIR